MTKLVVICSFNVVPTAVRLGVPSRPPTHAKHNCGWNAARVERTHGALLKCTLVWATPENGTPQRDAGAAFIYGYREAGGTFHSAASLTLYTASNRGWRGLHTTFVVMLAYTQGGARG